MTPFEATFERRPVRPDPAGADVARRESRPDPGLPEDSDAAGAGDGAPGVL